MTQQKRVNNDAYTNDRVRASELILGDDSPATAMLANSIRDGKPLADDGSLYDTIQAAENAASGFVFVPPGSFTNEVNITTSGLTMYGSGRSSRIEPSNTNVVSVNAEYVDIRNLTIAATGVGHGVQIFSDYATVANTEIDGSGTYGIHADSCRYTTIDSVYFSQTGSDSVRLSGDPSAYNVVTNCVSVSSGSDAFRSYGPSDDGLNSADNIIAYNVAIAPDSNGFVADDRGDNIIVGNRIHAAGGNGIYLFDGDDNIVVNNRISDSSGSDISDNTSTSTIEGNRTGSANS
jgi:parallel beta-helix repeat protein